MSKWFNRVSRRLDYLRPLRVEILEDRLVPATFEVVGTTLFVNGTESVDFITFTAGATSHEISRDDGAGNVESFTVDPAAIDSIVVEVDGDYDRATMNLGAGADVVVLGQGGGVVIGANYLITLSGFEEITVHGDGNDYAQLEDSVANDTFIGTPNVSTLFGDTGGGSEESVQSGIFINTVTGFGSVDAVSMNGGSDIAVLNDSAGNDTLTFVPGYAVLSGEGYSNSATGFASVEANATVGDNIAYLFDSAGDDSFSAFPETAEFNAGGFGITVSGFNAVTALFVNGGTDSAFFFGSLADENFFGNSWEASLSREGFIKSAVGAEFVFVDVSQGGADTAYLYDSPGDDTFTAEGNTGTLAGDGFSIQVTGFDVVRLAGIFGGTNTQTVSIPLGFVFITDGFEDGEGGIELPS